MSNRRFAVWESYRSMPDARAGLFAHEIDHPGRDFVVRPVGDVVGPATAKRMRAQGGCFVVGIYEEITAA